MPSYSSSLRLGKPTVGGDAGTWGGILDTDMDLLDAAIAGISTINVGGLSTLTLTASNGAADQSRPLIYNFTGALSGDCTVTIPSVSKFGYAINSTTGGHNVILTLGSGTTMTLVPTTSGQVYQQPFFSDGSTGVFAIATTGPALYAIDTTSSGSNMRSISGNYGAYFRNDGTSMFLLQTASGDQFGSNNGYRPFSWNLSTGVVLVDNTALGCTISSNLFTGASSSDLTGGTTAGVSIETTARFTQTINTVGAANMKLRNQNTGVLSYIVFINNSGTTIGSVASNAGNNATVYNTSSDYRLKVTYGPADGSMIDRIRVYDAAWKAEPDKRQPMMLAHELAEVVPWVVTGEKDAVDEAGGIVSQMVDYTQLVPALIAKVQELSARLAKLESK